ncbi:MAG: TonB-dependent receptor [Bryobacteraceae bacterium]|nr:TonB-dependent receptor [Bryobacteraceae bacterium]MDW8377647.1 TonB-dependent receptor [Bryobacterales bacterium]
MKRILLSSVAAIVLHPWFSAGQEVRASLTGTITDSQGAIVPGVTVTVTNQATNASTTHVSNEAGIYVAPFLPPGSYRVTAEKQGFKRYVRDSVLLQAQDRARLDIVLEVGEITQSVTVSADVSQLQTETASRSQIISNELIAQVPTQGRNPFQIAWAAPGVIKTGGWRYLRSFDIAGTSNFSVNGGRNRENEVLLDGISNVRGNRTVIHVPTMESVQEFKVNTNTYDAQYGRTGGGVVTIVTKSGNNQFHGTAFEYFQAEELNANQTELNRAGIPKPPNNINTFGIQGSGPIYIPKVLDLRNRLFWMVSYEGMRQRSADPGTRTFPFPEWRQGDFSTLRNAQDQLVMIYDPLTTAADGTRQPFAGNRIPANRINPIAAEVIKAFPLPNAPGDGPARINNYIFPSRWIGDMNQWIGRMDWAINSKNNFYFRYGQNPFSEYRGLVFVKSPSERNPAEPTGNAPLIRNGRNWTMDWTSTITPRMTFNLRAGLARWEETTGNSFGANFDPRRLGFADALVSQFTRLQYPRFDLGTFGSAGADRLLSVATNDAYTVQPNATLAKGRHILKFGAEGRRYNDNTNNPGFASGNYFFGRNWTQARALQPDAVSGNEVATFLLGYPTSGVVDRNIDPAVSNYYWAFFFQDDFKVTRRLTLNLGLRWDYEAPAVERYDRALRGMDFNAPSPIANRVQGLTLRGAIQFANRDGQPRGAFEPDRNNWQPRIGAAYRIGEKWVVRGGYGLYYLGQNEIGAAQGFSQPTSVIASVDGGLTPAVNLSNPFANQPGGRLLEPVGASQGAASFLGQAVTVNYLRRPLPFSHQYSFDIERELPWNTVAEVAYVGNITRKLPIATGLNVVPANQLGRLNAAGQIDTAYYTERIPNPMAGLIPANAGLNGPTIPRQNLLFPFPQFSNVVVANVPIGSQRYDGMQARVSKRMSQGFTFLASYSINKTLERVTLLNPQDFNLANPDSSVLEKRSANLIDIPQKFTIAGVWEMPFGKGRPFGAGWGRGLEMLAGGWAINANITYQSGWAADYPNAAQAVPGSAKLDSSQRTRDRWFDTSKWVNPATGRLVPALAPFTLRTFPTLFSDVRVPGYRNWDISASKYFPIREQVRAQFRFEMVNAFNTPWFTGLIGGGNDVTSPNFGRLNFVQGNLPRFLKLAMHLFW